MSEHKKDNEPLSSLSDDGPHQEKFTKLEDDISNYEKHYTQLALGWVFCYRTLLILSAALSATSAVVVNIGSPVEQTSNQQETKSLTMIQDKNEKPSSGLSRNDWAAILAAASTVITSSLGAIGLENEWRNNRLARDKVKALKLDLYKKECNQNEIITELQNIIKARIED